MPTGSRSQRPFGVALRLLATACLAAAATRAPALESPTDDLFLPALTQRSEGLYDDAAQSLRGLIAAHDGDNATVRVAFQHLFTTLSLDPAPKAADDLAVAIRDALDRYPDLTPSEEYCPRGVITLVQAVRLQMYGALEIIRPEGADVFLDGEHRGLSPLLLEFVRIGDRELVIAKDGFRERKETVTIEPGQRLSRDIELASRTNTRWYVAGGAVVAGVVWALLSGDDAAEPLPDPPPPPTAR